MTIEFQSFGKISRLANEQMTITEKIDGTNACITFLPIDLEKHDQTNERITYSTHFEFACQSRNRIITPESDNAGFSKWCWQNLDELFEDLGYGRHFGEWWGSGIQRGYGMERGQKFFSLFNAARWDQVVEERGPFKTANLRTVPLLYTGDFDARDALYWNDYLRHHGSQAALGFMSPEGVVMHLREAQRAYKITDAVAGEKPRMPNE